MEPVVPRKVIPSVTPSGQTPREVDREFRRLLADGAVIRAAGRARKRPRRLLTLGYTPKHKLTLFDTVVYLSNIRQNPELRFFVAYVLPAAASEGCPEIFARLFYKDVSLVWRSASHYVRSDEENWIGKGDIKTALVDGEPMEYSAEETTDLPFEIQTALETASRAIRRIRHDEVAVEWVLRRGPNDRLEAYRDFREPRRRAQSNPRNLVHGGRSIAWFARPGDPSSLRIAAGFEPDFARGVLERAGSTSRLYGGGLERFRVLSRNREVQYLFFAGPRHAWLAPPQATTTDITSYGVRSIDVIADEDLSIPGYEYHFMDDSVDPPELVSQIPEGFAGAPSDVDPSRADATAWLDRMPVVREFRAKVLRRRGGRARG